MMDFVKRIVLLLAFSSQLLYINVRVIFEIYFCINDVYVCSARHQCTVRLLYTTRLSHCPTTSTLCVTSQVTVPHCLSMYGYRAFSVAGLMTFSALTDQLHGLSVNMATF